MHGSKLLISVVRYQINIKSFIKFLNKTEKTKLFTVCTRLILNRKLRIATTRLQEFKLET